MKRFGIALLLLAVLVGGGFWVFRRYMPKDTTQVLASALAEKADIRGILVETGILKPQVGALVKIGARATGNIMRMNAKVGDRVRTGDLIALIDDREIQKALDRQRAALETAVHTLKQVQLTYPQRIREAEANHAYARINFQREQELLKHEYTTKDTVDRARSDFAATAANLERLREEYESQLKIAQATVEERTAQVRQQEVSLSYTKIFAPIDGIVSEVTAQEGETIVTGLQVAHLVTILDPNRLEMWIYVDETNIGKVNPGLPVEYYVDTFPERTFNGTIGKLYPEPVVKDNIVYYLAIVEVSVEDAQWLKPEMTSHVKIIFEEKAGVLTVPNAAIKFEEGKQVAYKVVGPNKVQRLDLKLGLRGEDRTEILAGVAEGDELATRIVLPMPARP